MSVLANSKHLSYVFFSWLLIHVFKTHIPFKWNFPKNSSLTIMNSYTFSLKDLTVIEWCRLATKCSLAVPANVIPSPVKAKPRELIPTGCQENRTETVRTLATVVIVWEKERERRKTPCRARGAQEDPSLLLGQLQRYNQANNLPLSQPTLPLEPKHEIHWKVLSTQL